MLRLVDIHKNYGSVEALKGVNLSFRKNEFVSILGPSGCGKTTLLNIVGGLDRYTSGDLIISGKSTKTYKDKQWDAYRNRSIGFVFQSYNLIPHLTVQQNVELSMTLSGINSSSAQTRAKEALEKVGLHDQLNKKPNQLSGGQMQRVAIARALVNDPEIILADEPTGALDSKTSVVIMELLKEIAKEKLVIMVTHNGDLAHEYSNRIIELLDGEVISDSNKAEPDNVEQATEKQKLTAMPYRTALSLSGRNLWAKKGRTILTSIAGSIGIIGIALVLALSTGLSGTINQMQQETLASSPITIEPTAVNFSQPPSFGMDNGEEFPDSKKISVYEPYVDRDAKKNIITKEYIDYIKELDSSLYISIQESMGVNLNLIERNGDQYSLIQTSDANVGALLNNNEFNEKQYEMLAGHLPQNSNELVLVVDSYNRITKQLSEMIGTGDADFDVNNAIGKEFKMIYNDDFYVENEMGLFPTPGVNQYESLYYNNNAKTLTIVGVMRQDKDASFEMYDVGLYYQDQLTKDFVETTKASKIVTKQLEVGTAYSVMTGQPIISTSPFMDADQMYQELLESIGGSDLPTQIAIVPKDFESKEKIREHLDAYNDNKEEVDQVVYTDMSEIMTNVMGTVINTISYVLIGFSSISLVVSSFMIGIITYVSVIERTKEIGVLRSLGARKKDISRVFNAETFLIGLVSGSIGILVTYLLQFPINAIVYDLTGAANIANLNPIHALILITISIALTFIAGLIPSRMAAKKDPVVALRTE
ncbi:ATP-binding cassette domain-containing protein [Erysipelothrix sp. HDW6C]|uniref:ABC transporter ATP-binding protein/permease n=1 Tax=Erysipelothrix sp. HDW6C TaxID=2714930 RepID=UPI001407AC47|nr:ABC transporter ATP-binding protein/permease [Erysipelothrix sp. HDW6C]QIK69100.1 ATP-binding cassette domain-containing protein [Erysipelothrix sp. HDW6C]